MKYIISGTNRPNSRSLQIAKLIQGLYKDSGESVEIIDLCESGLTELTGSHYGAEPPALLKLTIEKINSSEGLIFVVPEYNGSMPGVLKYFIDHWKFPESFENRPVCFIGLGGIFGGLRAVEHLQQVMGYRNAFMFPNRVFLINVWELYKNNEIKDPLIMDLLKKQVVGFQKFCQALKSVQLDANSIKLSQ